MRVHHLNCGTLRPLSAALINGQGSLTERGTMVCHCLLAETDSGLVLVDAGIGHVDIDSSERFGRVFDFLAAPTYDPAETALSQVRKLGFSPSDVRHIILTHLDFDHAGGLADFPAARVHVNASELERATRPRNYHDRSRYRTRQWGHGVDWKSYSAGGDDWFGISGVRPMDELDGGSFSLVPLPGHTDGHCGVAVNTGDGWLLHCGDAYFHRGQIDPTGPWCPAGATLFQQTVETNRPQRLSSLSRLQSLARYQADEITLISTHDPAELALFQSD